MPTNRFAAYFAGDVEWDSEMLEWDSEMIERLLTTYRDSLEAPVVLGDPIVLGAGLSLERPERPTRSIWRICQAKASNERKLIKGKENKHEPR
jgi:hypothetical protein